MVLISRRPGDHAWRFRESCPDLLRVGPNPSHVWSENRARVQWMNAAMQRTQCGRFVRFGRSGGQRKKGRGKSRRPAVIELERSVLCCFWSLLRCMRVRSDRFRFGFSSVEPSHDIGANRPRRDLCGCHFLNPKRDLVNGTAVQPSGHPKLFK
jgi:hypothetical protein